MGINGLSVPVIRDKSTAKNADINKLLEQSPGKNIVGIDMSVLIVKAMLSSPNAVSLYHSEPKQPLTEVTSKVTESVRTFISSNYKVVCVYDGITHKLKEEGAHVHRYGKNELLKRELNTLYDKAKDGFDNMESMTISIDRVNALRKKLCRTRPDIVHDIKNNLENKFKEDVVCVCAPFEADHQLASLFRQGAIDYVHTIDSDLVCLGADMMIDVNKETGSCWLMTVEKFLSERLPKNYNVGRNQKWTLDILAHVTCILGNDYLKKVPGAGKEKAISFVKNVTNEDGLLIDECDMYQHVIDDIVSKPTRHGNVSHDDIKKWKTDEFQKQYIKRWMESAAMFLHGPVFLIVPNDNNMNVREALMQNNYHVDLGTMSGNVLESWEVPVQSEADKKYNRTLLVGFDAREVLVDTFDVHRPPEMVMKDMFLECFQMHRWMKTGKMLEGLEPPKDQKGRELYFGTILNFEEVPVEYHSKEMLAFWLECRGVKVPDISEEVTRVVKLVYNKVGDKLQPIPKSQMKGASGWVTPELICRKDIDTPISWKYKDELVQTLLTSFPNLIDDSFTTIFGKRNGTRERVLRHLQGGSYNLVTVKATFDMETKAAMDIESHRLLVIEGSCAPSYKLKEDGKDAFHSVRLCIEVDSEYKFVAILDHPLTTCGCPVGWIWCAHKSSLLLLCHAVRCFYIKADSHPSFINIAEKFPRPVHELTKTPIPVDAMYPASCSKDNVAKREWNKDKKRRRRKHGKKKRTASSRSTDMEGGHNPDDEVLVEAAETTPDIIDAPPENADDALFSDLLREFENDVDMNQYAIPGIGDNSITPTLPVIEKIEDWVEALRSGRDHNGNKLKTVKAINDKLSKMVDLKNSPLYLATQIERCGRIHKCLERKRERDDARRKQLSTKRKEQEMIRKSNTNSVEEESDDSDDNQSNLEDKKREEDMILDSVLLDVLNAVAPGMGRMKERLNGKYDEAEVKLCKLVGLVQIDD